MNAYAQIKGRASQPAAVPSKSTAPAEDLTDAEIGRIAKNRDFVKQHLPELVELIKELHAAGLIDGWRSVRNCSRIKGES